METRNRIRFAVGLEFANHVAIEPWRFRRQLFKWADQSSQVTKANERNIQHIQDDRLRTRRGTTILNITIPRCFRSKRMAVPNDSGHVWCAAEANGVSV